MNACQGRNDIPLEVIERGLNDDDWRVRRAAINACQGRDDIPVDVIKRGFKDDDCDVRQAAINAFQSMDIPLNVIERWLKDNDYNIRWTAMDACLDKEIPLDVIERWLKNDDRCVRQAAMNACQNKEIPLHVIKRWMNDNNCNVKWAAICYCKQRGIENPTIRTIEPPKKVYKKCLNNVIVVATIPCDAEVRGNYNGKCRANKAKIIDIIGDFYGEKIGFSTYDDTTAYFIGDEIVIDDFDRGFEECSTGFHFFCTREQAENYD